jgi:lysyl-tRNA synthetase class II
MSVTNISNLTGYTSQVSNTSQKSEVKKSDSKYGRTMGSPHLSEKAQKYYDELKEKNSDMDFILVGSDMSKSVMNSTASYDSDKDTVVVVDEETIEKMANDQDYKKKYEGVLADAKSQLSDLKDNLIKNTNDETGTLKNLGIQINGDGTTSFFAVMEKNNDKISANNKKEQKETEKTSAKSTNKKVDNKTEKKETDKTSYTETTTVKASTVETLMEAIEELQQRWKSDSIKTPEEKMIGQTIDFRG